MTRPLHLSSKSEKRHMCSVVTSDCSCTAVVRRQLTSEVLHGAGLNYFMRGGMARWWSEGTLVAVHYGVYVPRLPARPQDCIIDMRPTPVPLHEYAPVYEQEKKWNDVCVCACMYIRVRCSKKIIRGYSPPLEYLCHAACRKLNWLTWYIVMQIDMQNDFQIDCQISIVEIHISKSIFQIEFLTKVSSK